MAVETSERVLFDLRERIKNLKVEHDSHIWDIACDYVLDHISVCATLGEVLAVRVELIDRFNRASKFESFRNAYGALLVELTRAVDALNALDNGQCEEAVPEPEPQPKPDLSKYEPITLSGMLDSLLGDFAKEFTGAGEVIDPETFQHMLDGVNQVAQELLKRRHEEKHQCVCALCVEERRHA